MPKFILPKPKKVKKGEMGLMPVDDFYRGVCLPANKEILAALEIGEDVSVTIRGKVTGLESREREGRTERQEFDLEIKSVEVDSMNEYEKMAAEDD